MKLSGNGTFRPRSVSATVFGRNVPDFMDVSFRPGHVNDSANK